MDASTADTADAIEIMGRQVTMPVEVRDASAGAAIFPARARVAQGLLPAGLTALRIAPFVTPVILVMVDYRDNDLGDYNEAGIVIPCVPTRDGLPVVSTVQEIRSGSTGAYIHRLPVNQEFTCAAGNGIWGYPKTVDEVEIDAGGDVARCTWRADGEFVWELSVRTGGTKDAPPATASTYSVVDGRLVATPFTSSSTGMRFGAGGGRVVLGDHPIADEVSSLLLTTRSMTSSWITHMEASFGAPVPVT